MDKVIQKQLALLKFAILPGILGGIACFIGPPHSALIKANIGVVIGFALQHKYMLPVLKVTCGTDIIEIERVKESIR